MEVKHIKIKRDDALVVRHNKLIEARYKTTLQQQRIMLWLISEIRPEDRDFQVYRVTIKELAKYIGVDSNKNVYREIAEATGGMIGRVLEIGSLKEERYLQVGLISSADYKVGEGYVDLSVDPKLRPYLLELKANFTKAYLRDLMAMKSVYSIRLYDLLNQYRKIGKREIEIDALKEILGLGKKYKAYKNFKARVINSSVKEINERTDLDIDFIERKRGKAVHAIDFVIKGKKGFRIAPETYDDSEDQKGLLKKMVDHGLSQKQAQKFYDLYSETDPSRITDNVKTLEIGLSQGKIPKPGGWLKKAIEDDWREQKSLFQQSKEQAQKDADERKQNKLDKERKIASLEKRILDQEKLYLKYRQGFVQDLIADLDQDTLKLWEDEFAAGLEDIRNSYWRKSKEWWSKIFISPAEDFIASKTGQRCIGEDKFYEQEKLPNKEELEKERQKLL